MIGTLISLGLGCYALGKVAEENTIAMNNKREAFSRGLPVYKDARGKYWATSTGEQCMFYACSPRHHGHDVIYGMKTGRVYKDYTQEKMDEQNREFERQGKPFRLKEYTDVLDTSQKRVSWKSTWWLYDLEKNLPYRIKMYYNPLDPEHRFTKSYLRPEHGYMCEIFEMREGLTFAEAERWKP